jgi:hypothetical protein
MQRITGIEFLVAGNNSDVARIVSVEPHEADVSFIMPDTRAFGLSSVNVIAKFCHFISFFAAPSSAERWVAKYPESCSEFGG